MIEGAVFDLGSTLIRFTGDWQQVMEAGNRQMTRSLLDSGLELDTAQLKKAFDRTWQSALMQRDVDFVERPMAELLNQVLAELGHSQIPTAVVDRALERMFSSSEEYWHPMPGVHEVLGELRQAGLRLGIISNASDAANVHRLVDKANLRPFFDPIVVSAEERIRKPDARIFEILLQAWDLPPQRVVMTGDSLPADIVGARQVGMYSIWLTADADTPSNRAVRNEIEPDAVAEELVEIPDLIRRRGIANQQEEA